MTTLLVFSLIFSTDPDFYFISSLYLSNHLKYLNDICKNEHSACLHFPIVFPDPYFNSFSEHNSEYVRNILIVLDNIIEYVNAECRMQNDNSAYLHFLIISPIHIFTSFLACISVTI